MKTLLLFFIYFYASINLVNVGFAQKKAPFKSDTINIPYQDDHIITSDAFISADSSYHGVSCILEGPSNSYFFATGKPAQDGMDGDFLFLQLDSNYQTLLQQSYHYKERSVKSISKMIYLKDSTILGVGSRRIFGSRLNVDLYLVKLNRKGEEIWTKTFDTGGNEVANEIMEAPDGSFYTLGRIFKKNASIYLSHWDASGHFIQEKSIQLGEHSFGLSFAFTKDNKLLILAGSMDVSFSNKRLHLICLDQNLEEIWRKELGKTVGDYNNQKILAREDDSFLILTSKAFDNHGAQIVAIKVSQKGIIEWEKNYGFYVPNGNFPNRDIANFIIPVGKDEYLIGGETFSVENINQNIIILKIDSSGELRWANIYKKAGFQLMRHAVQKKDGGYLIGGFHSNSNQTSFLLLDLNEDGSPK